MKVKRYTGSSLEKIRDVVIKELGENAVIVNIKKTEQAPKAIGILPVGKAQVSYEVTAAVDEPVNVDKLNIEAGASPAQGTPLAELLETQKEQYRGLRTSMKLIDEKLADVDEKMEMLSKLKSAREEENPALANIHDEWKPLLQDALAHITDREATDEDWHEALASLLSTAGGIMFRRTPASGPDVYVLIGPTGVGKTTSLAKLAAKCVLGEGLNVGVITIDTFRVGAVDQLREYASLLGIELAVAFSAQELSKQIQNFYNKDVVFIDTPGRSQFDSLGIKSIAECLSGISGLCTLMVVPAGIRREDAESMFQSYSTLRPSAMIVSKTDESVRCDGLTKLFDLAKIPVVYLADGQRVPEDLHAASPGIIASLIMPSVKAKEPLKIGGALNGKSK